jgi:hypothetical protein
MIEHCWHATGLSMSHGREGSAGVQCCHCGARASQSYHVEESVAEGHGPYYRESRIVEGPVEYTKPCVGRVP